VHASGHRGALALKPEQLARGEPILRRLTGSRASPITLGIIYAVAFIFIRAVFAWQSGCLLSQGAMIGFVDDPGLYTNIFFAAAIWAAYVWMPRGIAGVFNGLRDNKIVGEPAPAIRTAKGANYTYRSFLAEMQTMFRRWWWPIIALLVAIVIPLVLVRPGYLRHMQAQDWCPTSDYPNMVLALLWVIVGFYAFAVLFVQCVLGIYWLNRLFKSFTIDVRPLHPDGAGGLSHLGNFALKLSYLITIVGLLLVQTAVTRHYIAHRSFGFSPETEIVVGLVVYMVVAPIVFFAPLAAAHRSMREAKKSLLLKIDDRFAAAYNDIQDKLEDENTDLEGELKTFKELQELHDMVRKFPVWPFNADNLRRFGTSWMLPIMLGVLVEVAARLIA